MKNILIIGDSILAKNFLEKIIKLKNLRHNYTIVYNSDNTISENIKGDNITLREQLIEICVTDRVAVIKAGYREFIVCQHLHSKSTADINEHPADTTCTDNADRFAIEIKPGKPRKTEIEIL